MKVLVCGGRNYGVEILDPILAPIRKAEEVRLNQVLSEVIQPGDTLINGGAPGADDLAEIWAHANSIEVQTYWVDHSLDGPWPGAGPKRNKRMYDSSKPHLVIAFPGGRGTASMVRIARAGGTYVLEVE